MKSTWKMSLCALASLFSTRCEGCADETSPQDAWCLIDQCLGKGPGQIRSEQPSALPTFTCPITSVPAGITEADLESWLRMMGGLAPDQATFDALCAQLKKGIDDAVSHSAGNLPPPDPTAAWVWMKVRSKHRITTGNGGVETAQLEQSFPCGEGPLGTTLCASTSPLPAGDYIVVSMIMKEALRLEDGEHFHQFSVGFDANGDPSDNYAAPPEFPNDFWDGFDTVFEIADVPNQAPTFKALDLRGPTFTELPSAARVTYAGNTLVVLVPAGEIGSVCPEHRVTAFVHLGDYGLNPPNFWAGDTEPLVHTPLEPICQAT